MKIREAYEVIHYPITSPWYSIGFFWTKDEADMAAESAVYKVKEVRVVWDGTAWFKVGELTHLSEPTKTLPELVAELKIGSYVAVTTNGRLDKICRLHRKASGILYTTVVNGAWTLSFNAKNLLSATTNGNVHRIVSVDELPADIIANFKTHIGHELMPYIEQALEFYEERIGA